MSSFIRNIQRKIARNKSDYESAPQPTRITATGYETLRPTKGWLEVAAIRLAAQMKMAQLLAGSVPTQRVTRPRKNYSTFKPVTVVETVTRQQRRIADRKGVAA